MQLPPRLTVVSLLLLTLAACGGGGGSDGPALLPGLGATIGTTPGLDGSIDSYGTVSINTGLRVGDVAATNVGNGIVSVLSFDLSRVPPNAFITGATIRLYQARVLGNPYVDVGEVMVEGADIGSSVDQADFHDSQGIPFPLGAISQDANIGWKTLDVITLLGQAFQAGARKFDYRLRINGNGPNLDNQDDQMIFEDAENSQGTGNTPQLVLTWTLP